MVLNLVISFLPLHPSREEGVRHLYVFLRILNKKEIKLFQTNMKSQTVFTVKVVRVQIIATLLTKFIGHY